MSARIAIRCAAVTVLLTIAMAAAGSPVTNRAPVLDRLAADTIYHVVVSPADLAFHVFYGPIPLVTCAWQPLATTSGFDWAGLSDDSHGGWSIVSSRRVWSGRAGVPDRVVQVVARTVTADPDLIERIMPERFEVGLSSDLVLRVMTANGAKQRRSFGERWRGWPEKWLNFGGANVIEFIVTPQDAQTLYYALEPGTPVVFDNREP